MAKASALIGTLGLMLGVPLAAEEVALPDAGSKAALLFQKTCLATRGQGMDAAVAAILAQPGTKEGENLPQYRPGKPMRTFADNEHREYLVRPGKSGRYGCFVVLKMPYGDAGGQLVDSVRMMINSVHGLTPKPNKHKVVTYYEWSIAGSKDEIRLTPKSSVGGILINLEAL